MGRISRTLELAKALGLDEWIMQMPDGLDTPIGGNHATTLSEGMRQTIILVRSLVGNPGVLMFDDANAALDIRHDIRLINLLRRYKGSHTMVVVSHRPSLLRMCDRCYRLTDGKLELMETQQRPDATGSSLANVS